MHELGVGREGDRLRLHRRVDDHSAEVGRLGRAGARRRRETLLDHAEAGKRQISKSLETPENHRASKNFTDD